MGQASGAKQYHLVKRIGFVNMGIGVVIMLFVLVIYVLIPKTLISVYLNPNDIENTLIVHWAILLFFFQHLVCFLIRFAILPWVLYAESMTAVILCI